MLKLELTNQTDELVAFTNLRVGEAWITQGASLDKVCVVYVKVSANQYAELGGGNVRKVEKGSEEEFVRPVRLTGRGI